MLSRSRRWSLESSLEGEKKEEDSGGPEKYSSNKS